MFPFLTYVSSFAFFTYHAAHATTNGHTPAQTSAKASNATTATNTNTNIANGTSEKHTKFISDLTSAVESGKKEKIRKAITAVEQAISGGMLHLFIVHTYLLILINLNNLLIFSIAVLHNF